jgi:uncharacterized membrane protein
VTVFRAARRYPRLLVSIALAVAIYLMLPEALGAPTRWIIGWDVGAAMFLISALAMMLRAETKSMKRRAALQDEHRIPILALSIAAVGFSLFATGYELHFAKTMLGGAAGWRIGLAALTIVLSWVFTHTIFALHYAHEYYDEPERPRLVFPGGGAPDYTDFLYYAFVVGMTFQVSDVQVAEHWTRRLTLIHGVLSFFFNTVILALAINLAASLF